jgi:outer membrane lipoprotein SlyB
MGNLKTFVSGEHHMLRHAHSCHIRAGLAALMLVAPAACATPAGPSAYPPSEVGRPMRIEEGVIERVRLVTIEGSHTVIVGPAAGAVIGGLAGSEIGGGDEENAIAAIAGAVLGGLAGRAIEESVTRRNGVAYTIRTRDGQLVNIVQEGPALLSPGQAVLIEYGERTRVVAR